VKPTVLAMLFLSHVHAVILATISSGVMKLSARVVEVCLYLMISSLLSDLLEPIV
jgi:hypothetical protein